MWELSADIERKQNIEGGSTYEVDPITRNICKWRHINHEQRVLTLEQANQTEDTRHVS